MKTRTSGRTGRSAFTFVEMLAVIAIAAVLAIYFAVFFPRSQHPGSSNRVMCASNLRQISLAMIMYANDNKGHYPMTRFVEDAAPTWDSGAAATQPSDAGGPFANDVSAAMFLVMRTQDITAETFVCPSTNETKDTFAGAANAMCRSNFTSTKNNVSYSYHNPYTRDDDKNAPKMTVALSSDFPLVADKNPGTAGKGDNVIVVYTAPASRMIDANSNNHEGDGQNVAYTDAHVEWFTTPFAGAQRGTVRDNIYTAADEANNASGGSASQILARPADANDSILLPTDD